MNLQTAPYREAFLILEGKVKEAGDYALREQTKITRSFKTDGSVLTETDLYIDRFLRQEILRLFPEACIVSEESERIHHPEKANLTFVIDPIDGTDSYSQGMSGWCVGVGILGEDHRPQGGFLYAPSWGNRLEEGSFLSAVPGRPLLRNGEVFRRQKQNSRQAMISSSLYRRALRSEELAEALRKLRFDFRSIGSSLIHLVAPLLHSATAGLISPDLYSWDMAASHGILLHAGLSLSPVSGQPYRYPSPLTEKGSNGIVVSGDEEFIELVRTCFSQAGIS